MSKSKTSRIVLTFIAASLLLMAFGPQFSNAQLQPGTTENPSAHLTPVTLGSIVPQITETGKIALSIDGLGSNTGSDIIQVQKPSASATVRSAFMAAATTGFTGHRLSAGDINIDGNNFVWSIETSSNTNSLNYWGDVTNLVKAKIDAAPAGRVDFTVTETNTGGIDGELLAVIFDDPTLPTDNTIVLLFGAQAVSGDTFHIGLGSPLTADSLTHPLDLSLGISYGYQPAGQYSIVDVNGQRMTTSAGGQDDGQAANGALLTVGGLDDSDANPPDPYATDYYGPRYDDELYNLNPFVNVGDTTINVFTQNPSNDDNIFFAALNLQAQVAVVGEGVVLSPSSADNAVGQQHTVTATLQDTNGQAIVGRTVTFTIVSGPNAGQTATATSDSNGQATFTYTSATAGTDTIRASFVNNLGQTINSNSVTKTWSQLTAGPTARSASIATTDSLGNAKSSFALGEIVYVHLLSVAPIGSNANIEVRDSSNVVVAGPWLNQLAGSVNSFTPASNGVYKVYANGVLMKTIAVATFFVVPESILGTLMATVAGFAAFATIGIVKRKKSK